MAVRESGKDQWMKKNTASKACLFFSCQRRAVGVIRRSAADPGPRHWQAWPLPASCQRTAAGEAAGLLREDKASRRKREAETASSRSCPVTSTTNYPLRLWPHGHDCVLCGIFGTRKSVCNDPTGHIFCFFGWLFLFLSIELLIKDFWVFCKFIVSLNKIKKNQNRKYLYIFKLMGGLVLTQSTIQQIPPSEHWVIFRR